MIVGGQEFCNVTATWTPRVGEVSGIFAILIPALFSVIMFGVVCVIGTRGDLSPYKVVKVAFTRNTHLLYAQKYVGSNDYLHLETVEMNKKRAKERKFSINGNVTKFSDRNAVEEELEGEREIEVKGLTSKVTVADIENVRRHREALGCITLPLRCAHFLLVFKLIAAPIFSIFWDLVDVCIDTYYFYRLEMGKLIHPAIIRDVHVNNCIMAFACLGAIKSTLVALCYLVVLKSNRDERNLRVLVVVFTLCAVSIKLLFEDAPELILEYFYVDKYIVKDEPWYFVAKDCGAALVYIAPLVDILFSGVQDYNLVKEKDSSFAYLIYIPATLARGFMCLAMVLRVVGMIFQYSGNAVERDCFTVSDYALTQTPFTAGCLEVYDYVILVLIGLVLLAALMPAICFIFGIFLVILGRDKSTFRECVDTVIKSCRCCCSVSDEDQDIQNHES